MSRCLRSLLVAAFSIPLSAAPALGVPTQLAQQGRLLDGDGVVLTGTHALSFSLYDAEVDGTEVWTEDLSVEFEAGYYAVTLGEVTQLDDLLFSAGTLWLQLSVDGVALTPLQPVVSVPTALRAVSAEMAEAVDGGPVEASTVSVAGSEVINSSGIWVGPEPSISSIDWATIANRPSGLDDGDDNSDTLGSLVGCSEGQTVKWDAASSAWDCAEDSDTIVADTNTQLNETEVVAFVTNAPINLALSSTLGGAPIATGDHIDNTDTLGEVGACADGQTIKWANTAQAGEGGWVCEDDATISEIDPVFSASDAAGIAATDTANWTTAHGWGDHSTAGYLTSFTEHDPDFDASAASAITATDTANWTTAHGWGDHSTAGYLTSFTEHDPDFDASDASDITDADISNWNTAHSWGDHAGEGYSTGSHTVGIPSGAVLFFNLAACPAGWSELTAARGRYVVGLSASGTLGGSVGSGLSDLENRSTGQHGHGFSGSALGGHSHGFSGNALSGHSHSFSGSALPSHGHGVSDPGHGHDLRVHLFGKSNGGNGTDHVTDEDQNSFDDTLVQTSMTGISISGQSAGTPSGNISSAGAGTPSGSISSVGAGTPAGSISSAGSVPGTTAPYIQLLFCQKD